MTRASWNDLATLTAGLSLPAPPVWFPDSVSLITPISLDLVGVEPTNELGSPCVSFCCSSNCFPVEDKSLLADLFPLSPAIDLKNAVLKSMSNCKTSLLMPV